MNNNGFFFALLCFSLLTAVFGLEFCLGRIRHGECLRSGATEYQCREVK